jgi:16S rRNA (adenine1518-N6/adenine1519-N6)-dimethyltransferase
MKNNIQPLKRFGQNYILDKNILLKIAGEINPCPSDDIVEIGPGHGALTRELLVKTNNLTAIEIDKRVIDNLKSEFPSLEIINEDFLKFDLQTRFSRNNNKLRVVGNIPYNITSPVVFKLIENNEFIQDSVLMIQLEVAQRFTAERGSKNYGILAVILKYFADVKLCFKVSPNVFFPKPKVTSAVVHIFFTKQRYNTEYNRLLIKIVKAAFGNRRKTLKNSLNNSIFEQYDFSNSGIDLTKRAEQLDIEDFIVLTDFVNNKLHG